MACFAWLCPCWSVTPVGNLQKAQIAEPSLKQVTGLRHISSRQLLDKHGLSKCLERTCSTNLASFSDAPCKLESRNKFKQAASQSLFEDAKIVHGFTGRLLGAGVDKLKAALAEVVTEALGDGWSGVDPCSILVEDVSGTGGSSTYHITAKNGIPPEVALHSRSQDALRDSLSELRMEAAARVFSDFGLSGRRLAQGGDWFIEAWHGKAVGQPFYLNTEPYHPADESATPQELGELLARIHTIPIDWFEEWREQLGLRTAPLSEAPLGSHAWYFGWSHDALAGFSDEQLRTWISLGEDFAPQSPAASRVVTCHGDFHPGNIIRTKEGSLRVIDFETACVSCAAQDLAWSFFFTLTEAAEKRAFAKAYLSASSGSPVGNLEVDDLILDAECFALGLWGFPLWTEMQRIKLKENQGFDDYKFYKSVVSDARSSPSVRLHVIEHGILGLGLERLRERQHKSAAAQNLKT